MTHESWTASFGQLLAELTDRTYQYLPRLLGALVLLVLGWLVARLLRSWTGRALTRLNRMVAGRAVDKELKAAGADRLAAGTTQERRPPGPTASAGNHRH